MERHGAVCEEGLHFGDEEIALLEKGPHLELVAFKLPSLDARKGL